MTERREHLAPETLNMLMILKHNKCLWHIEANIQEILDSSDFRYADVESEDSEEEDDDAYID